jgi:hypothetical protein
LPQLLLAPRFCAASASSWQTIIHGSRHQKAVLNEEDPSDPSGKRFVGSVIWRTETVTPGPGQPPIRADVEVPERKLAMTWSLAAIDALDKVAGLRVVVAKSRGKHFRAGADLNWLNAVRVSSPEENIRASRATAEAVQRLNLAPVPTVALVQGACFGGGTGILAACDVVIAADNAIFSIAEVRWGLTAAIIIPQLNDAISVRQVRRYALTGERFEAKEARRCASSGAARRAGSGWHASRWSIITEWVGSDFADQSVCDRVGLERFWTRQNSTASSKLTLGRDNLPKQPKGSRHSRKSARRSGNEME